MTVLTVLLHSKVKEVLGQLQRESREEHLGVNKTQTRSDNGATGYMQAVMFRGGAHHVISCSKPRSSNVEFGLDAPV
jgi:hypothetical protein